MNNQKVTRPVLIRADRCLRNKWLATLSILVLLPFFLLWALPSLQHFLINRLFDNDSRTAFRLLVMFYSLFSILAVMLIATGMQLITAAGKVYRSGYFPAPDMRVIRDTWLVSGTRATFISYLLTSTGILLFIGAGSVPYYFHNLLLQLLTAV